jgi:hypothetical protein
VVHAATAAPAGLALVGQQQQQQQEGTHRTCILALQAGTLALQQLLEHTLILPLLLLLVCCMSNTWQPRVLTAAR